MLVKNLSQNKRLLQRFESSVNLQGSKTKTKRKTTMRRFESSVNLQGSKTLLKQQ